MVRQRATVADADMNASQFHQNDNSISIVIRHLLTHLHVFVVLHFDFVNIL